PDDQGNYDPNSTDAKYNEVAIDYNAGAVGAVAFLKLMDNPGNAVKISSAFKADPLDNVDLNKTPVKFTATFSQSVNWTINIIGSVGSKTITGSGTSINVSWDGSADKGCFLAGEIVRASLKIDKDIVAYDIVKATAQSIYIIGTKKGQPTAADVLVDNFDDKDTINKVGGGWIAFGTGTGLRQTSFSITEQEGSTVLELKGNVVTSDPKTFAGVKTIFCKDGSPVNLGDIKSIMFDLKSTVPANIRVELEQEDITDSAYYGVTVPTSNFFNNYRISISSFTQPDWATKSVPLNLNKIKALRFTSYDSTGMFRFYLDNVYIENLKITCNSPNITYLPNLTYNKETFFIEKSRISYSIPHTSYRTLEISIFDVMGKQILRRVITKANEKSSISIDMLPPGIYFAEAKLDGISKEGVRFTIIR
ncbi:MAG: glycoside hydrolase family 9 protein, partial [Chitinispirillaceae bacterium]|nr:glycoside hydrolase family 9 protein [Chitinispirillaceae bacterium]